MILRPLDVLLVFFAIFAGMCAWMIHKKNQPPYTIAPPPTFNGPYDIVASCNWCKAGERIAYGSTRWSKPPEAPTPSDAPIDHLSTHLFYHVRYVVEGHLDYAPKVREKALYLAERAKTQLRISSDCRRPIPHSQHPSNNKLTYFYMLADESLYRSYCSELDTEARQVALAEAVDALRHLAREAEKLE